MWQPLLREGNQTPSEACTWTGGCEPARDSGRAGAVSSGSKLNAFATSPQRANHDIAASVDRTAAEGQERNEKRVVAAGSDG